MPDCRIINGLNELTEANWRRLITENNPFLSYAFLQGLEHFDCLKQQYWHPQHIVIEDNGELCAVMPLYLKQDSYGEFVFDWAWADAYERAGRRYYPKLVSAIPFTPVTGSRLLVAENVDSKKMKSMLVETMRSLVEENELSSVHVLFPDENDMKICQQQAGLSRTTIQFHWFNQGYRDFKDFTDSLTSKKRKKLLHERKQINAAGIEIERLNGNQITAEQWQVFYSFYCSTFYKKWGEPRFTLEFFQWLGEKLPEQTLLILAKYNNEYIAGAFAMQDEDTLYGRHWGCRQSVPFLHFELCYYQTIEHVIEQGLKKLDAGVQGEHKLARGFVPVGLPSAHWIREKGFSDAIEDFLQRETGMMDEHIAMLKTHLPYKQVN